MTAASTTAHSSDPARGWADPDRRPSNAAHAGPSDSVIVLTGINRNYVGMIEREENAASIDVLEALAKALKVEPSVLVLKTQPGKS